MRINIRFKLFLVIFSILLITAIIFISTSSFILNKMAINDYEKSLVAYFKDFKQDYNEGLDFSRYLREKERGLRGFITLFDDRLNIKATTSPQLSINTRIPHESEKIFLDYSSDSNLDWIISTVALPRVDTEILILMGNISPNVYVYFEKPLSSIKEAIDLSSKAIFITLSFVLVIGFILAIFFARVYTKPILKINKKAQDIARLDFDNSLSIKNKDEIGDLGVTINSISEKLKNAMGELNNSNIQLEKEQKELIVLNKQLEELSNTDALTRLANRLKVNQVLKDEVYKSDIHGRTFSIILLDIDHFKKVNDTYGHQRGDSVLTDIANILIEDSRRIDLVGRWGGEEFMIILPDTTLDGAVSLAEHLRNSIEKFRFSIDRQITASFGVGEYNKGMDLKTVISNVDEALYKAKDKGRNRVELVDAGNVV